MGAYFIPTAMAWVEDWPELALGCGYSVSRMARRLGVSEHDVRSFCRHELGCTAKVWLMELRVAMAETLLAGEGPMNWLAERLGYSDANHFARHFERARGMSPTRWRAFHRESPQWVASKPVPLPAVKEMPTDYDFPWRGPTGYF